MAGRGTNAALCARREVESASVPDCNFGRRMKSPSCAGPSKVQLHSLKNQKPEQNTNKQFFGGGKAQRGGRAQRGGHSGEGWLHWTSAQIFVSRSQRGLRSYVTRTVPTCPVFRRPRMNTAREICPRKGWNPNAIAMALIVRLSSAVCRWSARGSPSD